MKKTIISLAAVVLIVLLALPVGLLAAPPSGVPPAGSDFSADEIVVRFRPGTTLPGMVMVHRQAGGQAREFIPALGAQVVSIPAGTVGQSIRRYASHPLVLYAEPNYVAEALGEPDDTYFPSQWGLHKVEAPAAWDVTTGSPGVIVAILDTGVDSSHPDLAGKIVGKVNFTDSPTAEDVHGHGTHVAGIAAASTNNGMGVAGLGYESSILNVKVLGDNGSGYYSWIASGITWAADNGARVINLSLGGTSGSLVLEDAVDYAWSKGVVVVAAAGNSGSTSPLYPAFYANCMAVAATDRYDARTSWSNHGDWVDVAAPGVLIFSTLKDDSYGRKSGTSMAAPHVAGLAALVFTVVNDANGNGLLNDEVRARIESTCDDIGVSGIGSGRINAARAVGAHEVEPQPAVELVLTADPASVSEAGTDITYTYTVSNTGQVTLTGIVVTDSRLGNVTLGATSLTPAASTLGTATYIVTQADIDAGTAIVNTAVVTCDQGISDNDSATVTIVSEPDVNIVAAANPASVSQAGDVIDYTYTVSNTGGVTLTGLAVTDSRLGNITLSAITLAPGASTTGTSTYTVTQADIDAGASIVNSATVTTGQGVSATDSVTVGIDIPEVFAVTVSPSARSALGWAGEDLIYVYTVHNTGNVPDTYDISTASGWASSALPQSITLAPEASATITVTHTVPAGVSPGDADTGTIQVFSAGTGASASATFTTTARVSAVQITPAAQTATAAPGEAIEYVYTISNTGTENEIYDLSLTAIWQASLSTTSLSLAAGTSATVVVSHVVPEGASGGDADTGIVTAASARANASATFVTAAEQPPTLPVIDLFRLDDKSNPIWDWATVDWVVSHEDGNLATVEVLMVIDGTIVDSATFSVAGFEASGTCTLRSRYYSGTVCEITLIVTDTDGNTTSQTRSLQT